MKKSRKLAKKNKPTAQHKPKVKEKVATINAPGDMKLWIWLLLIVFVITLFLIRWRLLSIPLERDEGEYAYMGQLMLQGIPPFELAYNMKFPGTSFMYGLLMGIFGQTTEGVHLGLALVNIGSILLLFFIAKEFMSDVAALLAAMVFGILSIGTSVIGFALHATHFVTLFALAATWVMLGAFRKDKHMLYFWSGLLFGLAFIMKQSGLFFLLFGGLVALIHLWFFQKYTLKKVARYLIYFGVGAVLPIALMMVFIYSAGTFDKFWFWTFTYLKEYGSQKSGSGAWLNFTTETPRVLEGYYSFWILGGTGLIFSFFSSGKKEHKIILWLLAVFAVLNILPGFFFRKHYFITLLPVIGLFCGLLVDYIAELRVFSKPLIGRLVGVFLLVISLVIAMKFDKDYLFYRSPNDISRDVYGQNPFPEAVQISEYIKANSSKEDRIAVLGSEPEFFFYSQRLSSTGYIYTYNMMEDHKYNLKMQQEMANEITANPPKFIVYVTIPTTWLRKEDSPTYIFDWSNEYLREHYTLTGSADLSSGEQTIYKWGNEAGAYPPESNLLVLLYQRR